MKAKKTVFFIAVSVLLLLVALPLSFAVGARNIPLSDLIGAARGEEINSLYFPILQKRIVRTVLGLIAGCALGTAGALMQSITRNPIADPSILGVNTGASFFVVAGDATMGEQSNQLHIESPENRRYVTA